MVAFSKRVLVVDDEPIVCDSYQRVLREEGYNVSVATTGRDALEQCRSSPVDVMLLDLKMPDIDGLEIARIVKQQFSDVQVVIITGYPTAASAAEAQELGVFHYVPKPLTPDQLVAITAAAVAFPPKRCLPTVRKPAARAAPDEPQPREVSPPAEPEPPDRPAEPAEEPPRMLAAPDRPTEVADEAAVQRSHPSGDSEQPLNTVCQPSPLRIALLLTAAPLIGLAYILILPILGFGMLLSAFGLGLLKAVSVFKK